MSLICSKIKLHPSFKLSFSNIARDFASTTEPCLFSNHILKRKFISGWLVPLGSFSNVDSDEAWAPLMMHVVQAGAPIIGNPVGAWDPGLEGEFVKDPDKILNFHLFDGDTED